MARTNKLSAALCCAGLFLLAAPANAGELMGDSPWDFNNQTSRASVAALMLQQQKGEATALSAGSACGGGGTATATANYTCVIFNNSNGMVDATQGSEGDQSAQSEQDVSANGVDQESLSSVLQSIQQQQQQ